jgi:hypothetical protein
MTSTPPLPFWVSWLRLKACRKLAMSQSASRAQWAIRAAGGDLRLARIFSPAHNSRGFMTACHAFPAHFFVLATFLITLVPISPSQFFVFQSTLQQPFLFTMEHTGTSTENLKIKSNIEILIFPTWKFILI